MVAPSTIRTHAYDRPVTSPPSGTGDGVAAVAVDAHVRRLRLKLGEARAHVETVVGAGYRFVARPGSDG